MSRLRLLLFGYQSGNHLIKTGREALIGSISNRSKYCRAFRKFRKIFDGPVHFGVDSRSWAVRLPRSKARKQHVRIESRLLAPKNASLAACKSHIHAYFLA
jgi:hypothetical protein